MENDRAICETSASVTSDFETTRSRSCNRTPRSDAATLCRIIRQKPTCGTQLLQLDAEASTSVYFFTVGSTTNENSVSEVCSELHSSSSDSLKGTNSTPFLEFQARQVRPRGGLNRVNRGTCKKGHSSQHMHMRVPNNGGSLSTRSDNNSICNSCEVYSLSGCSKQFSLHSVKSTSCMPISESLPSCSLSCFPDHITSQVNTTNRNRGHVLKQTPTKRWSESFAKCHSSTSIPQFDHMCRTRHTRKTHSFERSAVGSDSSRRTFEYVPLCSPRPQHLSDEREKSLNSQHSSMHHQNTISVPTFSQNSTSGSDKTVTNASFTQNGLTEGPPLSDAPYTKKLTQSKSTDLVIHSKDKDTRSRLSDRVYTGDSSTDVAESSAEQQHWRVRRAKKEVRVGRGSYGDVYRGIDLDTGRTVAIKQIVVPKDFSKDTEKQLQLLEREINVMRKLRHTNIVNYLGASREDNCINVFMEYVSGGTIGDLLRNHGPLSEDEARYYTKQLLFGLEYLHTRHIVHRDLKGDNLFLTNNNVLKLGDFGTSKELITTLVTDSVAGTPNFMAPEVIACSGHWYAADIWSIGCCVVEMLTGKPPFSHLDNHMAVLFAIIKGKIIDEMPPKASVSAKEFLRACTQHEPKDRWTAQELQQHPWIVAKETVDCNPESVKISPTKERKKSSSNADVKSGMVSRARAKKPHPPPTPLVSMSQNASETTLPATGVCKRQKSLVKKPNPVLVEPPQNINATGVFDLECNRTEAVSQSNVSMNMVQSAPSKPLATRRRSLNRTAGPREILGFSDMAGLVTTPPPRSFHTTAEFSVDENVKLCVDEISRSKGNDQEVSKKYGGCFTRKSKKTAIGQ